MVMHGGSEDVILSPQHMQALQDGKCVAFYDGEYVTFLSTQEKAYGK